jgi:hypothetical protein
VRAETRSVAMSGLTARVFAVARAPFAKIEQRRADEVADILDQHDRAEGRLQLGQAPRQHLGVEMTGSVEVGPRLPLVL